MELDAISESQNYHPTLLLITIMAYGKILNVQMIWDYKETSKMQL